MVKAWMVKCEAYPVNKFSYKTAKACFSIKNIKQALAVLLDVIESVD